MPQTRRRIGLPLFPLPCLLLGLLLGLSLCIFVSPGSLPQAHAHGFSMSIGTGWHSGLAYYGWPHGRYHRGWRLWPHYHAWFGVPLYPRYYYEPPSAPPRPSAPADASQAHKPPLQHRYLDISPSLHSLFAPTPPAAPSASPPTESSATASAPQNPHEQYIIYPIRGQESREAWERAQRWYLGYAPGLLKH